MIFFLFFKNYFWDSKYKKNLVFNNKKKLNFGPSKYLTGRLPSFSPEILGKHLAEQEEIPLQNI
jgi:hypothetical protein